MPSPAPVTIDPIQVDLDADRRWRERRHPQWTENDQLYRDTDITNRLTQRQSENVPLMKATIRTLSLAPQSRPTWSLRITTTTACASCS
ncbi:MAG TPA: hypothetical protein VGQ36_26820 [Thermoanaerobaculia bacterium]|jgi:hypothetical protein|nr:hypothetical protein [Thermoanaerobaculia bacterium]